MEDLYNETMEQNVLGSAFLNEHLIKDITSLLSKEDFFFDNNKLIYQSLKEVYESGVKVDYTTVINDLKQKGNKDDELYSYVLNLSSSVPSSANLMAYINIVSEWSQKRIALNRLVDITSKIKVLGIEELEAQLKSLSTSFNDGKNVGDLEGYLDLFDYFDEYVEYLEKPVTTDEQFKLGFPNLDSMVVLEKTNLMVVGADTGVGKTAFALNVVNNFCRQDKKVFFVSQEMGRKEVIRRMIALIGVVNAQNLKRKQLSKDDWNKVMSAKEQTKDYQLSVYDKGNMSIEMLYSIVSRLKKKNKIDVLVVDYLQLIEVKKNKQSRANEVAYVSRKLKQMAMEFELPVILLSQLNRNISNREGQTRAPQKSDLKESSSIEQDANIILMLHTSDTEQKFTEKRYIELFIRKQRDGVLGKTTFNYYGDNVKFVETEWNDDVRGYVELPDNIIKEEVPF